MKFIVFYVIFVVLCTDVLVKGDDADDADNSGFGHNKENWMIYGPIMVAILLIVSCVFSCKLRIWYRTNQLKALSQTYEKEQPAVVAILPESRNNLKESLDYRLLTPEYRPQTPSQHTPTPSQHTPTPSIPPRSPDSPFQTGTFRSQSNSIPPQITATYQPHNHGFLPPNGNHRPLTTSSSDHRVRVDSGNVSQSTTLTHDGRLRDQ